MLLTLLHGSGCDCWSQSSLLVPCMDCTHRNQQYLLTPTMQVGKGRQQLLLFAQNQSKVQLSGVLLKLDIHLLKSLALSHAC